MVITAKVHLDLVQQISDECQVSLVHIQLMNSIFLKLPLYLKFIIKLLRLSNYKPCSHKKVGKSSC